VSACIGALRGQRSPIGDDVPSSRQHLLPPAGPPCPPRSSARHPLPHRQPPATPTEWFSRGRAHAESRSRHRADRYGRADRRTTDRRRGRRTAGLWRRSGRASWAAVSVRRRRARVHGATAERSRPVKAAYNFVTTVDGFTPQNLVHMCLDYFDQESRGYDDFDAGMTKRRLYCDAAPCLWSFGRGLVRGRNGARRRVRATPGPTRRAVGRRKPVPRLPEAPAVHRKVGAHALSRNLVGA